MCVDEAHVVVGVWGREAPSPAPRFAGVENGHAVLRLDGGETAENLLSGIRLDWVVLDLSHATLR